MPEILEVETTRNGLLNFTGRTVSQISYSKNARSLFNRSVSKVSDLKKLKDYKLHAILRHGKFLVFHWKKNKSNLYLQSHLGMSGHWQKNLSEERKHEHLTINFSNNSSLHYIDARRFGIFQLSSNLDDFISPQIPDLISGNFNKKWVADNLTSTKEIKPVLLEQSKFPGVGNYLASEILYEAKISPHLRAKDLNKREITALHKGITGTLQRLQKTGGLSLKDYVKPDGTKGLAEMKLRAYNRQKLACLRRGCSGTIKRIVQAQRATFYCPQCQKL